jgi:hypothetical protein
MSRPPGVVELDPKREGKWQTMQEQPPLFATTMERFSWSRDWAATRATSGPVKGSSLDRVWRKPDDFVVLRATLVPMAAFELHGIRIFVPPTSGPPLHTEADAIDLITAALEDRASSVALPVERFDPEFFDLHTRSLGEFIQKFVIYKRRVVFVGDISSYLERSSSLRAFVREANEGDHVWFVADLDELAARIAGCSAPDGA